MPLDALLQHWPHFLWGGVEPSHEDTVAHADAAALVPFHHSSSSDFHTDLHASFLTGPPSSRAVAGSHYSAFLSVPTSTRGTSVAQQDTSFISVRELGTHASKVHARLQQKWQWAQQAGSDFKRTRLWYMARHWFHEHTSRYGVIEALGVGVLVGGVVLTSAPLPKLPPTPSKSAKEAAVDAFQSKRAQLGQGQMVGYETAAPHPKLPGDRLPAKASRRSGSSSGGGNKRSSARTQKRDDQSKSHLPADDELDSEDDGASMSA